MKIRSTIEKDIQILIVSEAMSEKDVQILRAGVIQLFRNGKNRIILELTNARDLPPEALREISVLDLMARELSGRILAAGVDPDTQARIVAFANPPVISCFPSRAEALAQFERERTAAPEGVSVGSPSAPPAAVPASKERVRDRELGELGEIRKQLAGTREENEVLREQLRKMVIERRQPPNAAAYQSRIDELESRVVELMARAQDAEAASVKRK